MAGEVETLLIRIGADIVDLKKGMADAQKSLEGLNQQGQKLGAGLGAALGKLGGSIGGLLGRLSALTAGFLSVRAAFNAFNNTVEGTVNLGNLSEATGIAVERLSALKFAAESLGLPFELLQTGIKAFTQRLQEGIGDNLSSISIALRQLGVDARDSEGNLRSFGDMLPEIADGFARMEPGIARAQRALALFGEDAGPKLLPLLAKGSVGLEELAKKAKELGVVFDADAVKKAREFQAVNLLLSTSVENLMRELIKLAGPSMSGVINSITELLKRFNEAKASIDASKASSSELEKELKKLQEQKKALLQGRTMLDALFPEDTQKELQRINTEIGNVTRNIEHLKMGLRGTINPFKPDPEAQKKKDEDIAKEKARIEELQFQYEEFMEAVQGSRSVLDEMSLAWFTHADAVEEAQARIRAAYGDTVKAKQMMAKVEGQLEKQSQAQMLSTASLAARAITELFPKSKNAAIAAAIINTAVGITKALSELLAPWSWIQAGLIAAMGAKQIATIRSTTQDGGGSTPTVDSGGGAGAPVEAENMRGISIQGIDPGALFSGRQMQQLLAAIGEETKLGRTLIATSLKPT